MTNWPEFYFAGANRFNTSETGSGNNINHGSGAGTYSALAIKSGFPYVTGAPVGFSSPIKVGSNIFIGAQDHKLHGIDFATGVATAHFPISVGDTVASTPASDGTTVYFTCLDGHVRAITISTGATLWDKNDSVPLSSSPTIVAGVGLAYGDGAGYLHLRDLATGNEVSGWPVDSQILGQRGAFTAPVAQYGSPIKLYFPGNNGFVYKVSLAGTIELKVRTFNALTAGVAIAQINGQDIMVVPSTDHYYYGVSPTDGSPIFYFLATGDCLSTPVLHPPTNTIGFPTHSWNNPEVHQLTNNATEWLKSAVSLNGGVTASPCVANGLYFNGNPLDDNRIWGFAINHADGNNPGFKYPTSDGSQILGGIDSSPIVIDGNVIVGVNGGTSGAGPGVWAFV